MRSPPSPSTDHTPAGRRRRPFPPFSRNPRRRDPDGAEGARWLGLVLSGVLFFVLYVVGTFLTWESTCSMAFGQDMEATPGSPLARFCLGQSTYQDNHHFWLWPIPLVAFGVVGAVWVLMGEWRWYGITWLTGALLAFLYYSPFLLLPG